MTIFDMILVLPFLWAIYKGFKDGVAVQLSGLAGLFVGIYFAFRLGAKLGQWLSIDPSYAHIVGFAIVVVVVLIGVAILGRMLRGVLALVGLEIVDKIGGVVLSILKIALILGILLYCFDAINRGTGWVEQKELERSKTYKPLIGVAHFAFPYINSIKEKLIIPSPDAEQQQEQEEVHRL